MALYNLIPDAFNILADSYAKIGELSSKYASLEGSPKQPKIEAQLIELGAYFDTVSEFIVLNDAGTAIVGLRTSVDTVNALLLCMKKVAGLNEINLFPLPFTIINTDRCCNGGLVVGPPGSILVSDGTKYNPLPAGPPGTTLTSAGTTLVWTNVVGNGLPAGGATGQFLKKNSNAPYDAVWSTLVLANVTDVTATFNEVNILHGVDVANVGPTQINTLAGINTGLTIQAQLNTKLSNALPNGQFWVGNASAIATPVPPTGDVTFNNAGVFAISPLVIVDGDVSATAGINRTKTANTNAYRVVVNDAIGAMVDNAAITPLKALASDANGLPIASVTSALALSYIANLTSDAQIQINNRLQVSLTSPAQGDIIKYNGTSWVNFHPSATAGQVLTSTGTDIVWGPATASGLPTGGTTNQFLRKNNNVNFDASWKTLVLADITNVTANVNEINALQGLNYASVNSTQFNLLSGLTSNVQNQINNKLNRFLAHNNMWVGDASGLAAQFPPGLEGEVLTTVGGAIIWQPGGGGGSASFIGLTDTPSSYVGQAGKIVQVRADETGLEFGVGGSASDGRKQYFATNGVQTVFTVTDSSPIFIFQVFVGGVLQIEGTDYTKNNGAKTVTFGTAPVNLNTVDVYYFTSLSFATLDTIPFWAAGSYTLSEVLVLYVLDGHVQMFRLKDSTRPYVSSNLLLEWCADDWELVSETGYLAINQTGHGFTTSKVVSNSGVAWVLSTPSFIDLGLVRVAVDANNFVIRCLNELLVGLSGLTPGQAYYTQSDGSIGTTETTKLMYIAVSSTKAIIVNKSATVTLHTFDSTFDSTFA